MPKLFDQPSLFETANVTIENSSYNKAANYLDNTLKNGIKPGTERIEALLKELKDPHTKFESILITGTNGKTSTARMICSLLASHGYQVGLYTSPHLHSYCERIEINSEEITEQEFAQNLEEIKEAIEKVDRRSGDLLTNFEIMTALAFYIFAKKEVNTAVLEVGMGARFDATCLTMAKVSVITNVELDHMQMLGDSIEKITTEKAYVIKEGAKVVTGDLKPQASQVVKRIAKEKNAEIYSFNNDFSVKSLEVNLDHSQKVSIKGIYCDYNNVRIPTAGKHQAENASLAIAAAELFNGRLLMLRKFKQALGQLIFNGRLEILQTYPVIVVDGAHNPAGARNLAKVIKNEFDFDKLILVLAIYKDKDYRGIVDELAPLANEIIFSENSSQRCLKSEELALGYSGRSRVIKELAQAIETAKKIASRNDLICITGSLATVADARMIMKEIDGSA